MEKTKIIPVVFLAIILGVGFVAFSFYNEKQKLVLDNGKIKEENVNLEKENDGLRYRYKKVEREKDNLEKKAAMVEQELVQIRQDKTGLEDKIRSLSAERDALVERIQEAKSTVNRQLVAKPAPQVQYDSSSEEHWADFVKSKASLEAKVSILNDRLIEMKEKAATLVNENKQLSSMIAQLTKEKEQVADDIKFKARTLQVMSMDLVNEREKRNSVVKDFKRLRGENAKLKRELILTSKEKTDLQNNLKETIGRKESFENRIINAEQILKEKALVLEDLREELKNVSSIGEQEYLSGSESASVELPPIVVKPRAAFGTRELKGEVIAVNPVDKFVVVNLGNSSNVGIGNLLKIMRSGREIGTIEVIETRNEISAADIINIADGAVIKEGDVALLSR